MLLPEISIATANGTIPGGPAGAAISRARREWCRLKMRPISPQTQVAPWPEWFILFYFFYLIFYTKLLFCPYFLNSYNTFFPLQTFSSLFMPYLHLHSLNLRSALPCSSSYICLSLSLQPASLPSFVSLSGPLLRSSSFVFLIVSSCFIYCLYPSVFCFE